MFLIERLVGVGTYSAILLFACMLISELKSNKSVRIVLFAYTIFLSIIGFFFVPNSGADLYRIYGFLDSFSRYDFKAFLERYQDSSAPASYIYFWLISKTGENRLLPAINTFICYSCIFYIFRKTMEKYNISKQNLAIALFFYMSIGSYIYVISGIRTMLAVSLIAFCFFRETVEKKFKIYHVLLYIIAAFMHNLAVVVIVIRFVIPLFIKSRSFSKKIIYIIFLGAISVFAMLNMRELFDAVLNKAEGYIYGEMYSYFWDYVIGAIVVIVSIFIFAKVKSKKYGKGELSQIKIFSIVCVALSLVFCFEFSTFHRLATYVNGITVTPLVMMCLEKKETKNMKNIILFASFVLLLLSCSRGSLCSLKFFVL